MRTLIKQFPRGSAPSASVTLRTVPGPNPGLGERGKKSASLRRLCQSRFLAQGLRAAHGQTRITIGDQHHAEQPFVVVIEVAHPAGNDLVAVEIPPHPQAVLFCKFVSVIVGRPLADAERVVPSARAAFGSELFVYSLPVTRGSGSQNRHA
jgi:hypothetical protein